MGLVSTTGFFNRGCPDQLILKLQKAGNYSSFIETGTYYGATTRWASQHFRDVITFEASEEIYRKLDFKSFPNVTSVFGDSATALADHLKHASIIYLDAHSSTEESYDSNPLIQELKIINESGSNHAIIVDDARYCTSAWDDFAYGELVDLIPLLGMHQRYVVIFDDMMIAVPREHKELVDTYIRKKATNYWRTYIKEIEAREKPLLTFAKNWLTPRGIKSKLGIIYRALFKKKKT